MVQEFLCRGTRELSGERRRRRYFFGAGGQNSLIGELWALGLAKFLA